MSQCRVLVPPKLIQQIVHSTVFIPCIANAKKLCATWRKDAGHCSSTVEVGKVRWVVPIAML